MPFVLYSILSSSPELPLPRAAITKATRESNNEVSALAAFPDGYWLNDMSGKGRAAFNTNPGTYKVFRNVKEYGAKGVFPLTLTMRTTLTGPKATVSLTTRTPSIALFRTATAVVLLSAILLLTLLLWFTYLLAHISSASP